MQMPNQRMGEIYFLKPVASLNTPFVFHIAFSISEPCGNA